MSKLFRKKEIEGVEVLTLDDKEVDEQIKKRKKIRLAVWIPLGILLFVFVLNIIILPLTSAGARTSHVEAYTGDNQYITFDKAGGLYLSAHRAGGDLAPEHPP